jgi:hypothetical protein
MKPKVLAAISFLAVCINRLNAGDALAEQANDPHGAEVTARVVQHGIFHQVPLPTGNVLTNDADIIPAKVGVMFGMRFEISNVKLKDGELLELTKIVSHPQITKPDGEVSFVSVQKVYFPVKQNTVVMQVGYVFEHDYELVPGNWAFEMQLGGKKMVKQEFTVIKE